MGDDDSKAGDHSRIAPYHAGLTVRAVSSPRCVETEAASVEIAIETRDGDLKLTGAVYFATDDEIWDKPFLLGLFKRKHRAKYGFRGGELRIALVNASAPKEYRFSTPLESRAELETGSTDGQSTEFGVEVGGEYGAGPKVGGKIGAKRTSSHTSSERVVTHPPTVVTKGPDRNPAWEYRAYGPRPLLGHTPDRGIALATLLPIAPDVAAHATFLIDAADVTCEAVDPPGRADPKRLAVLKQAFSKYLLRKWQAKGLETISVATARAQFSSLHGGGGTALPGGRP